MTFQNKSTIHFAAVCNTSANLVFLIEEQHIDVHVEDAKKQTPLMWALKARKGAQNIKTVIENTEYQFQKDHKDQQKKMAVHYLAQYGCRNEQETAEIVDLFMVNKAKFSMAGGWNKFTPLLYAATYGNIEVVQYFLERVPRININKGDKYKRTPLAMACRNGHAKIAALLIKHNADLEACDTSGNTALHYAAAYGWTECVEVLVRYGANPNPENAWKTTPIDITLKKNHLQVVKELLNICNDINVNTKDDEGRTLLTLAMANINVDTPKFVDLLINDKHADPNI